MASLANIHARKAVAASSRLVIEVLATHRLPPQTDGAKSAGYQADFNRDPYIIHLKIALSMVVSPYFGGKSHVSNGQNVSFKERFGRGSKVGLQNEPW